MVKSRRGREARKVKRVRNGIIGAAVVVVVAVLGYGLLYSTGVTESGEFVAGEHYRIIEDARRRRPGAPIVVTEFFSYACVHCRNLQPLIEDWRRDLPDDVRFERSPVSFNASWAILAQAYAALEQLGAVDANHERIFRAIHDNGRQFPTSEQLADFVDGRGTDRQAFLDAYNSGAVRRKVAAENARQRRFAIASTPTLVVAGRYAVGVDVSRRQALDTVDYLIKLERGAAPAVSQSK